MHTMGYIEAATTGILSPHVLLMEDLRKMLLHIEETLPSTMHLPVSSEDTLHFYRYICIHILIADKQFLLLIDVPIQDHAQQLEIYEVFNLVIPHRYFSARYNINSKYLGITYDETKAVEISQDQFSTCQKANGQFCSLNTPLQLLANPPMCIASIICKEQSWHWEKMLTTNHECQQCEHPHTNCFKCLDTDFNTYSSVNRNNAHPSWRGN